MAKSYIFLIQYFIMMCVRVMMNVRIRILIHILLPFILD